MSVKNKRLILLWGRLTSDKFSFLLLLNDFSSAVLTQPSPRPQSRAPCMFDWLHQDWFYQSKNIEHKPRESRVRRRTCWKNPKTKRNDFAFQTQMGEKKHPAAKISSEIKAYFKKTKRFQGKNKSINTWAKSGITGFGTERRWERGDPEERSSSSTSLSPVLRV